jgi:outer membrane protein with beta-barrel domain
MIKAAIGFTVFALALAVPGVALAQPANPNCPPGSWFCAETNQQPAAPPGQPVQPLQPLPGAQPQQPTVVYQGAPPVVVYQPPPPVVVYQARPTMPPPPPMYYYHPRALVRRNEWGLNLHLEGAMIGGGYGGNAGMGGGGFGLRYKPVPGFGLEADLDFLGGRDYNGYHRNEQAFTINSLIFLNPRSRAQVYLLAGFGWSGAQAVDDQGSGATYNYSYFGGQAGAGLEIRVAQHFALNADLRGFIRGRVDQGAQFHPEFTDPNTGQTTNTSAGGLITVGSTIYF